ncbi:MAG TPA: VOC family protein [Candidatus Acidoferrales bacterium]|nr:VOC family protein [Candidatus Acidoferrales bacterium]
MRTAQRIYPAIRYENAKAAIEWLTTVLGFKAQEVCPGEGDSVAHAELALGGNLIMLGSVQPGAYARSAKALGGVTATIYVALDTAADVDASYARAKSAGADVIRELSDTEYGSREFGVCDLEGHVWSFGTYRPQA